MSPETSDSDDVNWQPTSVVSGLKFIADNESDNEPDAEVTVLG
jgi:hypothetical protein